MEEVRSIGSLPCLEHVALLNNPLSIIPDYRTKVLAQFGERASEVSCSGTRWVKALSTDVGKSAASLGEGFLTPFLQGATGCYDSPVGFPYICQSFRLGGAPHKPTNTA